MVYLGTIQELQKRQQEALTQTRQGLQQKRQEQQPEPQYGFGGFVQGLGNLAGGLYKAAVYDPFVRLGGLSLTGAESILAQSQRPGGFDEGEYNRILTNAFEKQRTNAPLSQDERRALAFEKYTTGMTNTATGDVQTRFSSAEDLQPWQENMGEAAAKQFATTLGGVLSLGGGGLTTGGVRALGGIAGKTLIPKLITNVAAPGALMGYGSTAPGTGLAGNLIAAGTGAATALGTYGALNLAGKAFGKIGGKIKKTISKAPKVADIVSPEEQQYFRTQIKNPTTSAEYQYNKMVEAAKSTGKDKLIQELQDQINSGKTTLDEKTIKTITKMTQTALPETPIQNPFKLKLKSVPNAFDIMEQQTDDFLNVLGETRNTTKTLPELSKIAGKEYVNIMGGKFKGKNIIGSMTKYAQNNPDLLTPDDGLVLDDYISKELIDNWNVPENVTLEKAAPKLNRDLVNAFTSENPLEKLILVKRTVLDNTKKNFGKPSLTNAPTDDQIYLSVNRALQKFFDEKVPDIAQMNNTASKINAVTKNSGFLSELSKQINAPAKPISETTQEVITKVGGNIQEELAKQKIELLKIAQQNIASEKIGLPIGAEYDPRTAAIVLGQGKKFLSGVGTGIRKGTGGLTKFTGKAAQRMIPPALGGSIIKNVSRVYDSQTPELDQLEQMLNQPNIDYNTYNQILKQWATINNTQADMAEAAMEEQQNTPITSQDWINGYTQGGGDITNFQDYTAEFSIE